MKLDVLNVNRLERKHVEDLLNRLLKSEPPTKLAEGAMCYKQASPPDRYEYVCPACLEKTLYSSTSSQFLIRELAACRVKSLYLNKFGIYLDESQFCKMCSPEINHPRLNILVYYVGIESPYMKTGIYASDLDLLINFFNEKNTYYDNYDFEFPLKNSISQLELLLNLKTEK